MLKNDDPVVTKTYWIPSADSFGGYAWIVIDSQGRFTTISDYGNYGYWWSNWGPADVDFRDFIRESLCPDVNYTAKKLGQDRGKIFLVEETKKSLRKAIIEHVPKHQRAEELALLSAVDSEVALSHWHSQTKLEDPGDHYCYDFCPQVYAFCEKVMPRFKAILDEERKTFTR